MGGNMHQGLVQFYREPYKLFEEAVLKHIPENSRILDIGCGEGVLPRLLDNAGTSAHIYCVDINPDALRKIRQVSYPHVRIDAFCEDAARFLDLDSSLTGLDVIVCHAALHELSRPEDHGSYADWFFQCISGRLRPKSIFILGDYHYIQGSALDEDVSAFIDAQKRKIGHADQPEKFMDPVLLRKTAIRRGFDILAYHEQLADKDFGKRFYYLAVMSKGAA